MPTQKILIYLDQKDYGALLDPQNAALRTEMRGWIKSGVAVAPISLVHFIETTKAEAKLRMRLFDVMLEMSDGALLRGIPQIVSLESEAAGRVDMVRDGLLSYSVFDMFGVGQQYMTLESYLGVMDLMSPSQQIHATVEKIWGDNALQMNSNRARHPSLLAAYSLAFQQKYSDADLPTLRSVYRHLAVLHAIHVAILTRVQHGMTGHDIGDSFALACALPYFDVVGLDKKMLARVQDADVRVRDLRRARVERRLDAVVAAAREHLAQRP